MPPPQASFFPTEDEDSEAGENVPLTSTDFGRRKDKEDEPKGWDIFEDPPIKKEVGSLVSTKKFEVLTKIAKVIAYILTFCIVLGGGVVSKGAMLFMTSQLKKHRLTDYCNKDVDLKNRFTSKLLDEERVAWAWALIFAFMAPEIGTFIRSARIFFFKNHEMPSFTKFTVVLFMETLHTIGMAILIFLILPELDVVKGVMLTNCVCLIPGILGMLSRSNNMQNTRANNLKSMLKLITDVFAICSQLSGFIVWPLLANNVKLYFIPLATILISCGWWENYVLNRSSIGIVRRLAAFKETLNQGRYVTYAFVSLWKCLVFLCFALLIFWINGEDVDNFFKYYSVGFGKHNIYRIKNIPVVDENNPVNPGQSSENYVPATEGVITSVIVIQAIAGYLCYIFGKFACKIVIQGFSYALPICLTIPVCVTTLLYICGLRTSDPCYFHDTIPPYLFFYSPKLYSFSDYITVDHAWIWIFWLASQVWITLHIWTPQSERLMPTEKLYVTPMYNGLLLDQSMAMNRKQEEPEVAQTTESDIQKEFPDVQFRRQPSVTDNESMHPGDKTSKVIVCGTMWHETKDEMIEFLKSIIRLDEDQCSRRLAGQYYNHYDRDYYEVETHIFFDDAFDICKDNMQNTQINQFVKLLLNTIDEAASEVHQTHIRIRPPKAYPTPYGGRLIWQLPGKTLMIAHLKDKDRIRHKKRWSQVMYMYYMLGYRLMDLPIPANRKAVMAKNTYLLALDGDIDFKPQAVLLLIDLMKRNSNLAAACGRIHPIGAGPMVWYQKFEYAIGHWLQKATEHMIGCVLCSPGCFSLFRGEALMDKNVMKKYTTKSHQARHFVQYDQGEDRWLCTLLLQRGWRVEYSAASDAYTHCPEGFNEFYNQRRRWIPSTMANIFDLLLDSKRTVKANPDISNLYIFYQIILMAGSVLGPGTIFLMLVGAFVAAFKIDNWSSLSYNLIPILIFMTVCLLCNSKIQLFFAGFISAVYGLIMIAVIVALMVQITEDGPLAPSSLFFFIVAGELIIAAIMHPQEFGCLPYGLIYYVTVPSMYMLLIIYAAFNMNDVSWGTREVVQPQGKKTKAQLEAEKKALEKGKGSTTEKILGFLRSNKTKEEEGSVEFSFAGLFKCMLCTHDKNSEEKIQLMQITNTINSVQRKLDRIERNIDPTYSTRRRTTINCLRMENGLPPIEGEDMEISASDSEPEIVDKGPKETRDFLQNPFWIDDPLLSRSRVDFLPDDEKKFWNDLLEKYLHPIKKDEQEEKKIKGDLKDLRDKVVFAFFMLNALFVLVIFLLQLNKDIIHIRWPLGVKSNITYNEEEITINSHYLELEPIGVVFLAFFALILIIQFTAMLFHRLGTLSHLLAISKLNIMKPDDKKSKKKSSEISMGSDVVELVRRMMSLKHANELDKEEEKEGPAGRRKTIHHLENLKGKRKVIWKLEEAFNKRVDGFSGTSPGNTKVLKDLRISTQDLEKLQERRKTVVEERRKTQFLQNPNMTNSHVETVNHDMAAQIQSRKSRFEPDFFVENNNRLSRPSRVTFSQ